MNNVSIFSNIKIYLKILKEKQKNKYFSTIKIYIYLFPYFQVTNKQYSKDNIHCRYT